MSHVNTENVLQCFYKTFLKTQPYNRVRVNSLSHSSKHAYRPMRERIWYQLFYNVRYKFCPRSCMAQSEGAATVVCNVLLLNLLYVQRKLFSSYAVNSFLIVCWTGVERKSSVAEKHSSEQTSKCTGICPARTALVIQAIVRRQTLLNASWKLSVGIKEITTLIYCEYQHN